MKLTDYGYWAAVYNQYGKFVKNWRFDANVLISDLLDDHKYTVYHNCRRTFKFTLYFENNVYLFSYSISSRAIDIPVDLDEKLGSVVSRAANIFVQNSIY